MAGTRRGVHHELGYQRITVGALCQRREPVSHTARATELWGHDANTGRYIAF